MAADRTAKTLVLPHKAFDIRSAVQSGPEVGGGGEHAPCPGMLDLADEHAYSDGDPIVEVGCDHCGYSVGVRREVVDEHLVSADDPAVPESKRDLPWRHR